MNFAISLIFMVVVVSFIHFGVGCSKRGGYTIFNLPNNSLTMLECIKGEPIKPVSKGGES